MVNTLPLYGVRAIMKGLSPFMDLKGECIVLYKKATSISRPLF